MQHFMEMGLEARAELLPELQLQKGFGEDKRSEVPKKI